MKPALSDEIISAFNRRDSGAFSRIFLELFPVVWSYVKKLVRSSPAAKDLTADAFVRLWEHQGGFESIFQLRAFLFQTAKNLALDHLRHARTEKQKLLEVQKLERDSTTGNFHLAESHGELTGRINRAIEDLPRKCRQIFLLFYTKGLTNNEIARQLRISTKTVSNQKSIALKVLRMRLTKMRSISVPILFAAVSHAGSLLHFSKP